ncbi:MAG: MipA/OmpV family protein [Planctomycetota bacterium]|jgi:outer membrane protein
MNKILYICILALAVEGAAGRDFTDPNYAGTRDIFMVGAGAVISLNPHKGISTRVRGIPILVYRKDKLSLYGPMMNYSLYKQARWEARAVARVRFEGYEEDDSKYLRGMEEREWTLELGSSLSRGLGEARVTADFTADVLNKHKGYEAKLSYNYDFRAAANIRNLLVTPSIGVTYRSSRLNDYYYGVRSSEAIPGRPEYKAGDSVGLMTALRLNYRFSRRWSTMGMASLQWLGKEITDSPIVEKNYRIGFLLGIMCRF